MKPTESDDLLRRAQEAQDRADFDSLEALARAIIDRHTLSGNGAALARGYRLLGNARHYHGDARGAETAYQHGLDIAQAAGDDFEAALAMVSLGNTALEQRNDQVEGRRWHELALPAVRASGDLRQLGILTGNLGEIARVEGDYEAALAFARESLEFFESVGDLPRSGWQKVNIALVHALRRRYAQAFDGLRAARETLQKGPNAYWNAMYFDVAFMIAVNLENRRIAGELMGYVEEYRHVQHVPRLLGLMNAWYPPCVERLARALTAEQLVELRTTGALLDDTEAHALIDELERESAG